MGSQELLKTILADAYTIDDFRRQLRIRRERLADELFRQSRPENARDQAKEQAWRQHQALAAEAQKAQGNKVIITLAIKLPKKEIRRLGRWFRANVHPQVLLDLRVDPQIIGGAIISWQGIEKDFSLRSQIKNIVWETRLKP